jgi:phosphohistidine swiveling domain-containing protein
VVVAGDHDYGRFPSMAFLLDIVATDPRVGGKALSLAQLAQHGLPTPAGFVIADELYRALCPALPALAALDTQELARLDRWREQLRAAPWPGGFRDQLHQRLDALATERFAVRSSFAGEDRLGSLAAGVFESCVDVPRGAVEQAIREVLASALAPGAVAYALAHGQVPARAPLAVLVHGFVAGSAAGGAALVATAAATPILTVRRGELATRHRQDIATSLAVLVAARGPCEVEWVVDQDRVVYLQARPFQAPPAARAWPGWAELGEPTEAATTWHWDMAHNPLPLSPAQAGLVELADEHCLIGVRQRVLGGYLFYAKDKRPLPPPIRSEEAAGFFSSLRATVEARLAALGDAPALEDALDLFVLAYQPLFGVLQPALRLAHAQLDAFLTTYAPAAVARLPGLRAGVPSMASERLARAARLAAAATEQEREQAMAGYLELFGQEAPIWDVATPTHAEQPTLLFARLSAPPCLPPPDWRQASVAVLAMLDPSLHAAYRAHLGLARTAVGLGEDDDWLYARMQAAVRRALLTLGRRLVAEGALAQAGDVCDLPFPLVRALGRGERPVTDLGALAAAGHRAWQTALALPPPTAAPPETGWLRGSGTGGRAIGRVVLHRPSAPRRADTVLVARTLLPTELPLLSAVALVTETGGPLDHVAAQARERGIPAVVSVLGATEQLAEGAPVLVDGDRGLVIKL